MTHLTGRLIDLHQRRIHPARITIEHGRIIAIEETVSAPDRVILPGFVDAHIHIESSMLVPVIVAKDGEIVTGRTLHAAQFHGLAGDSEPEAQRPRPLRR